MAVQQLEKKMSSLRSWLAHIEMELSRPIVYDTCDEKEIEKKLNQQQVNGSAHKAVRVSTYMVQVLICTVNFISTDRHNRVSSYHLIFLKLQHNKAEVLLCCNTTPLLFSRAAKLATICKMESTLHTSPHFRFNLLQIILNDCRRSRGTLRNTARGWHQS